MPIITITASELYSILSNTECPASVHRTPYYKRKLAHGWFCVLIYEEIFARGALYKTSGVKRKSRRFDRVRPEQDAAELSAHPLKCRRFTPHASAASRSVTSDSMGCGQLEIAALQQDIVIHGDFCMPSQGAATADRGGTH